LTAFDACGKLGVSGIDVHRSPREVLVSRVQLALNVDDIDQAVAFYTRLFGAEPAKRRPATPTSRSPSRR